MRFINKTYVSIGDFIDLSEKIKFKGISFVGKRLQFSRKNRIKASWQHTETSPTYWQEIPEVRERINQLISGNQNIGFTEYIYREYLKGRKGLHALSPGCGTGTIENQLAGYPCFSSIEAFDLSETRILKASREAKKNKRDRIDFYVKDVYTFDFGISRYDLVLLNHFLHHINGIESILKKIRKSMKQDGILVLHDYVGPNRFQWKKAQLRVVNNILNEIPVHYRRYWKSNRIKRKQYRPGLIRMIVSDPSEAVESECILPVLKKLFTPIEIKDLGGNLMHLLFKDIAHHFLDGSDKESERIIKLIFNSEDHYMLDHQSDFIFGVFSKH